MTAAATLGRLREQGWAVAVHNDYMQGHRNMTFWLLTHPSGVWAKGEGDNDAQALSGAYSQAQERRAMMSTDVRSKAQRLAQKVGGGDLTFDAILQAMQELVGAERDACTKVIARAVLDERDACAALAESLDSLDADAADTIRARHAHVKP